MGAGRQCLDNTLKTDLSSRIPQQRQWCRGFRTTLSFRRSLRIASIPPSAETAKTIVSTVSHGTLSTLLDDGTPLGTYVAYVLNKEGILLLRLRSDAVHKRNLERNPKCSLFVQAADQPARKLARVSLIGSIDFVSDDDSEGIRALYQKRHPFARGVDCLRDADRFGQLNIDRVFYVGGLDGRAKAEEVSGEDFMKSEPDPLRFCAPQIVQQWNTERMEDIYRLCKKHGNVQLSEMTYASLSWVDRLGCYITYDTATSKNNTLRLPFPREVEEDRDARSLLTMAAHLAWKSDRNIIPTV